MRRLVVIAVLVLPLIVVPTASAAPTFRCFGQAATIVRTAGPERIFGTVGSDTIAARGGDDVVFARTGDDRICAGDGDDAVQGSEGDDVIGLGPGNDSAQSGPGADVVYGDGGDDGIWVAFQGGPKRAYGGEGNDDLTAMTNQSVDLLDGGPGFDDCYGGRQDRFVSCERIRYDEG